MKWVLLAIVVWVSPITLNAQEKRALVDWGIVFAENSDLIERKVLDSGNVVDVLTLPSGIVAEKLYLDKGISYRVRDPNGPVACILLYNLHVVSFVQRCAVDRNSERGKSILRQIDQMIQFVKKNAVPPMTDEEMETFFSLSKVYHTAQPEPLGCGIVDNPFYEPSVQYFMNVLSPHLSEILEKPRPPVLGDCL